MGYRNKLLKGTQIIIINQVIPLISFLVTHLTNKVKLALKSTALTKNQRRPQNTIIERRIKMKISN